MSYESLVTAFLDKNPSAAVAALGVLVFGGVATLAVVMWGVFK